MAAVSWGKHLWWVALLAHCRKHGEMWVQLVGNKRSQVHDMPLVRCRVHTLALPVVATLGLVFRGVDLEAQLSVLAVNLAAKVRHP